MSRADLGSLHRVPCRFASSPTVDTGSQVCRFCTLFVIQRAVYDWVACLAANNRGLSSAIAACQRSTEIQSLCLDCVDDRRGRTSRGQSFVFFGPRVCLYPHGASDLCHLDSSARTIGAVCSPPQVSTFSPGKISSGSYGFVDGSAFFLCLVRSFVHGPGDRRSESVDIIGSVADGATLSCVCFLSLEIAG